MRDLTLAGEFEDANSAPAEELGFADLIFFFSLRFLPVLGTPGICSFLRPSAPSVVLSLDVLSFLSLARGINERLTQFMGNGESGAGVLEGIVAKQRYILTLMRPMSRDTHLNYDEEWFFIIRTMSLKVKGFNSCCGGKLSFLDFATPSFCMKELKSSVSGSGELNQ